MNDLELDEALAEFRDDVPDMTEDAFLIGRLRLQAAAEPAPEPLPEPNPLVVVRVETFGTSRRRSPPRRLTPWLTVAAAAAVLAVGTTLVVNTGDKRPATPVDEPSLATTLSSSPPVVQPVLPPTTSFPSPPRRPAAAKGGPKSHTGAPLPAPTVVYNAAGNLAVNATDVPLTPGQYLYMERREWMRPIVSSENDNREELEKALGNGGFWHEWVPADRSGTWQLTRDMLIGYGNQPLPEEQRPRSQISGLSRSEGTFQAPKGDYGLHLGASDWRSPTSDFIAGLPRDPKALYQKLVKDSTGNYDPTAEALSMAGELLSRPIPADIRAALFKALGYHPWLKIDWAAKTRDGRAAVALQIDNRFIDHLIEVLIDPATGQAISTRETQLYHPRKVDDETTTKWSVVNSLGATS
ncbi:hypothetical protein LWC34_41165 [Kibdelosporangium philippinense]|uniref:CU044_5270 family protein n=1 Tax=Kibdelosporangium philippinense TaxID=211113 RepID=A0ABS8ZN37_9PSEU|nr:hypothetical protein [Kibdelosporangium philippinense]MCE7009181.1 hypothetical protein [Kibdelosporangium philippinense]